VYDAKTYVRERPFSLGTPSNTRPSPGADVCIAGILARQSQALPRPFYIYIPFGVFDVCVNDGGRRVDKCIPDGRVLADPAVRIAFIAFKRSSARWWVELSFSDDLSVSLSFLLFRSCTGAFPL